MSKIVSHAASMIRQSLTGFHEGLVALAHEEAASVEPLREGRSRRKR